MLHGLKEIGFLLFCRKSAVFTGAVDKIITKIEEWWQNCVLEKEEETER